jgi:hypothetical protein
MKYVFRNIKRTGLYQAFPQFKCHSPKDRLDHGGIKMSILPDLKQVTRVRQRLQEKTAEKVSSQNGVSQ